MINPKKESSQFMTQQEIHLEKQREAAIEREKKERTMKQNQVPMNSFKNNNYAPVNKPEPPKQAQAAQAAQSVQPNLKAPMDVQDILNRLHKSDNNSANSETQDDSSNNDRLVSNTSSVTNSEKRARKKKAVMKIV